MKCSSKDDFAGRLIYTILYKDSYFIFLKFFICFLLFIIIYPLFFIDYNRNIFPDIIAEYFLYGDIYTPILRILAIMNIIAFFFYKEYYMFLSIGNIYVHDDFLLCKPKIFIFKEKKIYYKDAFISNIGKKIYMEEINSILISNSISNKNLFDMLCSNNIFFNISPVCINDKNEIMDIHMYIINKINKHKNENLHNESNSS